MPRAAIPLWWYNLDTDYITVWGSANAASFLKIDSSERNMEQLPQLACFWLVSIVFVDHGQQLRAIIAVQPNLLLAEFSTKNIHILQQKDCANTLFPVW